MAAVKRPVADEYREVMQIERRARIERIAKVVLMLVWVVLMAAYGAGILHPEWFK